MIPVGVEEVADDSDDEVHETGEEARVARVMVRTGLMLPESPNTRFHTRMFKSFCFLKLGGRNMDMKTYSK